MFLVKPRDQRVGMNGIAKFECAADGNPPPSVFWTKEGSQVSRQGKKMQGFLTTRNICKSKIFWYFPQKKQKKKSVKEHVLCYLHVLPL